MRQFIVMSGVMFACAALQADIIYFDGLNGEPGTRLYGQAPDIDATGTALWVSQADWMKDGSLGAAQSTATIPFTPQAGQLYQLTVGLVGIRGDGNWVGVGYAGGTSTASGGNGNRFISAPTAGQPWMFKRGSTAVNPNQMFYGPGTTGPFTMAPGLDGEDVVCRIILDTRPSAWVATWQQKVMGTTEFQTLQNHTYAANPAIAAVGLARSAGSVFGQVDSILLENVDERAAAAPFPGDGQADVPVDTAVLGWNAGSVAGLTGYLLHFSEGEPNLATTPIEVAATEDPVEVPMPVTLQMDKTYYWFVTEIAEPNTIMGSVWQFSTLKSAPQMITEPLGTAAAEGETASFSVRFASLSTPTASWYAYVDGTNDVPLAQGGDISMILTQSEDAYTATLSIANVQIEDERYYYCVISNPSGQNVASLTAGLTVKRLLAHYPFDGDIDDHAGTNNATLRNVADPNATLDYPSGMFGSAVQLDGTQYLELSTDAYPKPGLGGGIESGTFSCWVQIDAVADGETTVFLAGTHNQTDVSGYQFWLDVTPEDINMRLRTPGGAPHKVVVPGQSLIGDGKWHLLAATYAFGGELQVYFDGIPMGDPILCPRLFFSDWEFPVLLGANNNRGTANGFLKGFMDDVRIHSYPLTGLEVADMYLEGYPDARLCILPYENAFDFDGNCIVNLADFAQMAAGWLSCGSYPDCQ